MGILLYIEASPRKERSSSIEVARSFIDEYQRTHSADIVDTLDLWNTTLPEFDGDVVEAKYLILHGEQVADSQRRAWAEVEQVISRFTGADKYLFSLPMWNFGIPYKLKHYFDVLVQPTYTFNFSPQEGYHGLVVGKPAAAIYARGGSYQEGSEAESFDLQKRYLELVLGFIGLQDIQSIVIEPTLASAEDGSQGAGSQDCRKILTCTSMGLERRRR
ncbi:MAG: NAD(P)H-dependent oxidoreductase [Deltaproteobacteria bacterium]|nr:NAD(P)H-dependent oxidoreductase [Deltaproteobacteria bacterium]